MATPNIEAGIVNSPLSNPSDVGAVSDEDLSKVFQDLDQSIDVEDPMADVKRQYINSLASSYGNAANVNASSVEEILGNTIKANQMLGFTDDLTAKFARNIRRLKGDDIADLDVSEIFGSYKIPLPPLEGIDLTADDAEENIEGWAAKAKSLYNLTSRSKSPELLAYRDEVFDKIDDTAKYLNRQRNSTDSGVVDFFGRLGQGVATFADSLGLDDTAQFINDHVVTNPEWDDSISAVIGQSIGQAGALVGGMTAATVAGAAAAPIVGVSAAVGGTLAALGIASRSGFHGTANERYEQVMRETGNEVLADDATNSAGYYLEAGLDTIIDASVVGAISLKPAAKIAKAALGGREALKESLSKQLLLSLAKSQEKTTWLDDAVGVAGDMFLEGTTEAAQGAIQQADLSSLTGDKSFDALDINSRAMDFIGGAAGGAFASGTRRIVPKTPSLPEPIQQKIMSATEPLRNATNNLSDVVNSAVDAGREVFAPYVKDSVNAIRDAATPIVNSTLQKTSDAIDKTNAMLSPMLTQGVQTGADLTVSIYNGAKKYLGDKIQSPVVQQGVDAVGSLFTRFRNNTEEFVPATEETAVEETPAPVTEEPALTDVVDDTPAADPVEAPAEVAPATTEPVLTDPALIPPTTSQAPRAKLKKLPKFRKANLTPKQAATQLERKNFQERTKLGLEGTGTNRIPAAPLRRYAPKPLQNFLSNAIPNARRDADYRGARASRYLASPEALKDLTDAGVSPDSAADHIQFLQSIDSNPDLSIENKRLVKRQAEFDLLGEAVGKDRLNEVVAVEKYSPKQKQALTTYFNRKAGTVGVAQPTDNDVVDTSLRDAILEKQFGDKAPLMVQEAQKNPVAKSALDDYVARTIAESGATTVDDVMNFMAAQDATPDNTKDDTIYSPRLSNKKSSKKRSGDQESGSVKFSANQKLEGGFNFNQGAIAMQPRMSSFEASRVAARLGTVLKAETIDSKPSENIAINEDNSVSPDTRKTGKFAKRTPVSPQEITIDSKLFRGSQAVSTFMHELGEMAARDTGFKPLLESGKARTALKKLSDSIRTARSKQTDFKEQLADALAVYFNNPSDITSPILKNVFDTFAGKNFKEVKDAIEAENAIPLSDKLAEAQVAASKKYSEAQKALREKNVDARTPAEKLRDIATTIRQAIFNKSAPVQQMLKQVKAIAPQYAKIADSMAYIYEQFKNRTQSSHLPLLTFGSYYTNSLAANGVSLDTFNTYLKNNRIANEITAWERLMGTLPQSAEISIAFRDFQDNLKASPIVKATKVNVDTQDTQEFINAVHEIAARVWANNETNALIQELRQTSVTSPDIFHTFINAFSADNVATSGQVTPQYFSKEDAAADNDRIRNELGAQKTAILDEGLRLIADVTRDAITEWHQAGGISDSTYQFYMDNVNEYATFQLADIISVDPYIDAVVQNKVGSSGFIAGPAETTVLKMGAIKSNAARQRYANQVAALYYQAANTFDISTQKPIGPKYEVVATTGKNYSTDKVKHMSKDMLFNAIKGGAFDEDGSTVIVITDKGTFSAIRIGDANLAKVFEPDAAGGDLTKALNATQVVARSMLTTYNPAFALRSALRIGSRVYAADERRGFKNKKLTMRDAVNAFFSGPIAGVPVTESDRQLISQAWTLAGTYLNRGLDLPARLNALQSDLPQNITAEEFLNNPDIIMQLENMGLIVTPFVGDIISGLDPDIAAQSGFGKSEALKAIEELALGKPAEDAFNRLGGKLLPKGIQDKSRGLVNSLQAKIDRLAEPVKNLNTRIEFTEKIAGIATYLRNGDSLEQAVVKANLNFGNPDPRNGGYLRAAMSPLMLYASPALNGMRVLADSVSKGLSREDGRVFRASAMAVRNKMVFNPMVFTAGAYALTMALTAGDDEEAEKNAEIARRLINKIPTGTLNSGMAIPLSFRNPRTNEMILPSEIESVDSIDPSWETVYLQIPYDQSSAVFTGMVGSMTDALTEGLGVQAAVAGAISSASHALPSYGPLVGSALSIKDLMQGRNPVDNFTGRPVISEEDFETGGLTYTGAFLQNMVHDFAPILPDYKKAKDSDKTKINEFTMHPVHALQSVLLSGLGIIKATNYGDYERSSQGANPFKAEVRRDLNQEASDKLVRLQELTNLATDKRNEERDRLVSLGVNPKDVRLKTLDMLPPNLQQEYQALNLWKRSVYDTLSSEAEVEFRTNGKTSYYNKLVEDIKI
jgi:hypothetical protein